MNPAFFTLERMERNICGRFIHCLIIEDSYDPSATLYAIDRVENGLIKISRKVFNEAEVLFKEHGGEDLLSTLKAVRVEFI